MEDRIEKRIELKAPVSRVWRALTDYREFGEWFRVALEGPFVPGKPVRGRITWPGAEHLIMTATVQRMEPERLFSFTWHPYAIDPNVDYSSEPETLVEFTLEAIPEGTLLVVVEFGICRPSPAPARRGVPHERAWLVDPDREHRPACWTGDLAAGAGVDPAVVFAALGDATRLSLIGRLSAGTPLSISRLAEGSALTRQAVTKHLRVLETAGVVGRQRSGRESLYRLEPARLVAMRSYLDGISQQWDEALARLKAFVER